MVAARDLRRLALVLVVASCCAGSAMGAEQGGDPGCPAVWPPGAPATAALSGALDAGRLLLLREIGHASAGLPGASPLAVSPDGRRVAFFVQQAVPAVNDRCESLVVIDLAEGRTQVLDSGGRGIRLEEVLRGVRRPSGLFDVNIPAWSPDGRSLVYRKRVGQRTQLWRAWLDAVPPAQITRSEVDIESFAWAREGDHLLYTVRPGRLDAAKARLAEARRGYLYDARVLPHIGPAPQLPADLAEVIMALPARGGVARAASLGEIAAFDRPTPLGSPDLGPHAGPDGYRAAAEPVDAGYFAQKRLWAARRSGERIDCLAPGCTGNIVRVWWHGGEVMFLRREGWLREENVISAWSPKTGRLRTVLRTGDWLSGCAGNAMGAILCLAESARQPRRLVAFDPVTGAARVLFDPNPDIDTQALPRVERLRWRNALGLEAFGDRVIPQGAPPKAGWPLVVVQYTSRGFLRGGTGDEYPIFPLAQRGIAVLSLNNPDPVASLDKSVTDGIGMVAAGTGGWADRRSVHDSLTRGLDLALARGDIDANRIGIGGFSDGSTTARFALINANRYAAAAISHCCLEPHSALTYGGIAQGAWFRSLGYPKATEHNPDFWGPMSLAMNAAQARTPLLMQLSDDEYIQALETFGALRDHDRPVEMLVFPGEHHLKWQPLHRAAVYERNLDWFAFWLQDYVDPDPAKAAQYGRWEAMKALRGEAPSKP